MAKNSYYVGKFLKLVGTSLFGTIALASILALGAFSLIIPQASAQTTQTLGDFYCWNIVTDPPTISTNPVNLIDQFHQYENLDTFRTLQFCDAADKDRPTFNGVFDFLTPFDAQHYTTYFVAPVFDPPNQVDLGIEQFAILYTDLNVGPVKELWVPDTKKRDSEQNSEASENEELHYLCYEITEDPINQVVQMQTQFGIVEFTVLDPILLCNPVFKEHNQNQVNIDALAQREHLTCFNVQVASDPVPPVPDLEWLSDQLSEDQNTNIAVPGDPTDHKACFESFKTDEGVAGSLVPINSSMLLLAGAQMIGAWIIPAIVASAGIAIVAARKY